MNPDELRDLDEFLGAPARQPCEECERAERLVVLAAVLGGALLGAVAVYAILHRPK